MADTIIGRVVATEKNPTTIDIFTFWTDPELMIHQMNMKLLSIISEIHTMTVPISVRRFLYTRKSWRR